LRVTGTSDDQQIMLRLQDFPGAVPEAKRQARLHWNAFCAQAEPIFDLPADTRDAALLRVLRTFPLPMLEICRKQEEDLYHGTKGDGLCAYRMPLQATKRLQGPHTEDWPWDDLGQLRRLDLDLAKPSERAELLAFWTRRLSALSPEIQRRVTRTLAAVSRGVTRLDEELWLGLEDVALATYGETPAPGLTLFGRSSPADDWTHAFSNSYYMTAEGNVLCPVPELATIGGVAWPARFSADQLAALASQPCFAILHKTHFFFARGSPHEVTTQIDQALGSLARELLHALTRYSAMTRAEAQEAASDSERIVIDLTVSSA
jgi:hypothetical protein